MMEQYNINQTTLRILGLYASDYKKSLHLREIARETKVDVKAVQLQLKRLEKRNIFSSITKGRNREYYLNLSNSISKYYMILAETFASLSYLGKNFLIKKVIDEIGNHIEGTIILFGSFAKGEASETSDIDLFVVTEKRLDRSIFMKAGNLISRETTVRSSTRRQFLKGLENGDALVREVISNHVVLKGIDQFCDTMWRYYARK